MVVGYKQSVIDPGEPSFRGPQGRLTLASAPPCPLMIFPLAAERRPPTQ